MKKRTWAAPDFTAISAAADAANGGLEVFDLGDTNTFCASSA